MIHKIEKGTRVQLTGLPTGFKKRNLIGRSGKITGCVDYSGICFHTVLIDKKPLEKELISVPNVTANRLKIIE